MYQYKSSKILIHNTNIKEWEGFEGIVYKNDHEYFRFTDKTIGDNAFLRTIGNTTIKYVNNNIIYIDSKINSKLVEPLKMDLARDTNYGTFDIETFQGDDGVSYVYALGFYIHKENILKTFYIKDDFYSPNLVHNCFTELLKPKFMKKIFYVYNLGKFDKN